MTPNQLGHVRKCVRLQFKNWFIVQRYGVTDKEINAVRMEIKRAKRRAKQKTEHAAWKEKMRAKGHLKVRKKRTKPKIKKVNHVSEI